MYDEGIASAGADVFSPIGPAKNAVTLEDCVVSNPNASNWNTKSAKPRMNLSKRSLLITMISLSVVKRCR